MVKKTAISITVVCLLLLIMFVRVKFIGSYARIQEYDKGNEYVEKTIKQYGGDHVKTVEEGTSFPPDRYIVFYMTIPQYIHLLVKEPSYRGNVTVDY